MFELKNIDIKGKITNHRIEDVLSEHSNFVEGSISYALPITFDSDGFGKSKEYTYTDLLKGNDLFTLVSIAVDRVLKNKNLFMDIHIEQAQKINNEIRRNGEQ